jgi:hypothetical protein
VVVVRPPGSSAIAQGVVRGRGYGCGRRDRCACQFAALLAGLRARASVGAREGVCSTITASWSLRGTWSLRGIAHLEEGIPMRLRSRLLLTAVFAVTLLALAVGAASATRLRVLNFERGFRIVWAPMSFTSNTGASVSCNVTIEGTFARATYEKRAQQVGSITRASVGASCTGGSVRALTESLPWALNYVSFGGTLPAIATVSFNAIRVAFAIAPQEASFACLLQTTVSNPASAIANFSEAGGGLRRDDSIRLDETRSIPLSAGPFGVCGLASGSASGTGTASVLGEAAKTTIALI